jgi:hypothetical protein
MDRTDRRMDMSSCVLNVGHIGHILLIFFENTCLNIHEHSQVFPYWIDMRPMECLFSNVLSTKQCLREIATFIGNVGTLRQKTLFKKKTLLQCS